MLSPRLRPKGEGIQNENINNWINAAIYDINQPGTDTKAKVDNIKLKVLDLIYAFQDGKTEGYAEGLEEGKAVGRAEAFGEMGTPCDDCPAVEVSKGTTTIQLYNPDKVEFKK